MLENTEKLAYLDLGGAIRSRQAEETIAFLKPFFKDFGITRVANITGLDCLGVPVAVSIRPNSKHLSTSQGKGLTWELAVASAVMESIEGYHAENPAEPDLQGSYRELAACHPVIDPQRFNPGYFSISYLQEWPMAWIKAKEIISNKSVFIPHVLVCLDSTRPHSEYSFLSVSTNGLAAGNDLKEATCHALYEIIERDSLCRWANFDDKKRATTQIKLDTVNSKQGQQLIKKFEEAGQWIKLWDITSEIGVPTFHCVMRDTNPLRRLGMFRGTGTHFSKEVALIRTLTEVAQSRLTLISGSRDDVFLDHYQQSKNFTYSSSEYEGQKDYRSCLELLVAQDFSENIKYLLQKLYDQGFKQVFLVDHTKPEFNIPVVHVFIPGMQFNGTRI